MSLLLKSWESHALAKLCLRAGMESVGHWPLHKDVTLTSSLDGEAMGGRHTARAILQRFLCSSFPSLMSGDLSCCGVRRGRVMQAASSWRHLTEDPVLWETDTPGGFQSVLEWRKFTSRRETFRNGDSFAFWKELAFHQQREEPRLRLHYPEAGMCVSLCVCKLGTSVFLWAAVPMCVYTCLHPSLCFSLWVHIYEQVCKCMCECVLMWAYVCWYKCTSVYVWVLHTCVNMCFCMCRYVNVSYACLYMCVHKVWMYVTWKESHGNV